MKNWKRFIAACLSVTMVASIPLTAFAEASVSVTDLVPKDSKEATVDTTDETDLEKILSQEKPYEYFSGLKDQEKLLNACKDEELFQLKEYMKYAYIHESDLKNRQSLDAYLLISEAWKNRKVTFKKEEQEQLLQFLEDTNVYGTKYKDGEKEKTVEDFPTYMEYLQSIKKFEVPRYVEFLSAFDEAKTEDDLAKAMEAFSNFEEEIYGFDEQETEKESEKDTSPETSEENPKGESNKNNSSVESVEEDSITPEEENEGTSTDNNSEITLELPEGYYLDSQLNSPDFYSERYIDTNRKTIHLYAGSSNKFGYISGKIYWITGDNTHVFCLDPLYKGPDSKEYTIQSIRGSSDLLTKVMYYGYSGPGFSNSGLSTGNSVTDYYYTHFVAAYVMEGCPGASSNAPWESRCLQMIGATHQANVFNWYKKIVNMPAPPSNARSAIFQGTANGSTNQIQRMGFFLWEAKKNYKLTLNPNGGVANGTTSPFTLSPDIIVGQGNWCTIQGYKPTRTGYTFTGWYDAPSGGTKVYGTDGWCVRGSKYWDTADHYIYEGNLTVYAQWTPNIAHITYNVQGGTVGNGYGTNSSGHVSKDGNVWFDSVSYGNSTDPYNASTFGLTKTGYHFGGWRIRSNGTVLNQDTSYGSTTYVDYSNSSLNTSNTPEVWCYLDAIWVSDSYTNFISHWLYGFNNEGTNSNKHAFQIGSTSFSADNGNTFTLGANNAVTPPHGCFVENYIGTSSVTGSWTDYKFGQSFSQKPTAMGFQYNYSPYDYSITYNLNGGNNNSANPSSYNVLYGVSLQNPTRAGYTFAGWEENLFRAKDAVIYSGASRNGETFTFTNSTSGNSFNAAKVQVWTNDFGRHIAQPVTAESGTNSNVSGKYTHNESTGNYIIRIAANGTAQDYSAPVYNVYLEKGKTYTFTIGSSSVTSNKVVMGNIKVLGTATGINAGKNATFSNSEQLYSELAKRQIGDVELTAKWTPNTYTVKYDGNGATGGSTASSTHTYDVAKALTANGFTKTGYTFKGWNTKADGSGTAYTNKQSVKNLTSAKGATVTLYAQWTPNTYTIKYDGNGATGGSTANSTHTYDVSKTLTPNGYIRIGYTFKGWNTKVDGSGTSYTDRQAVKNLASVDGATVILYAQWTPHALTVRYHLNGGTDVADDPNFSSEDPARVVTYTYPNTTGKNGLYDITTARVTPPTGYLISGHWNTRPDGSGTSFDFTTEYTLAQLSKQIETGNAAVDLYAQWTPKKLVTTFHKNDGSTTTATQTFTYDVAGQKFSDKKWTKTGYTLLGWADSKTATKSQYAVLSGVSNAWIEKHYPKNDVYAVWRVHNYTIQYDGNTATGGSTPSSNHTYDKSQTLTPNGFEKDGYYFDSWNTKPDGSGNSYQNKESVKNLSSKDGDTVILYAQWKPINYKIVYKGNGSTGGTEKTHLYNQKDVEANGYAVKNNKGYTDFVRTNHTLVGWYQNSVVNTKAEMAKIYKQGNKLTYSQLLAIHAEQVKKGLVKDTDPKVKEIILYAIWDEAPSIDTSTIKKSKFYEGVDVTRTELLAGITASDKIDGSLTSQIIITRIDYSAGKLVNGKKQAAYSQTWANGMPADAKLDTWFMQLDKKDSPVTHTVTYQVKDSAGNITTAKKTIQVVYNEFPTIKATDFQFELKDAQTGKITKDVLLAQAVANGIISASDTEDGDMKSKIELIDYDANAFKTMKQEGFVPITYRVQDSMGPGGKGKITLKTVNVNIFIRYKEETVRYVRFINKKYYDLNANLDRAALAGKYDQIALLSANGGLHPFSVWYRKTDYRDAITSTFEKTTGTTYVYTKDDIKKMREFVKQHGVGNAKEEDALSKFADIFMTGDYILK